MRKRSFYKNKTKLGYSIREFVGRYRWFVILFVLLMVLGLVCGIFVALKSSRDLSSSNLTDWLLVKFLKNNCTLIGYFAMRLLISIALIILILIFSNISFLVFLPILLIVYQSYTLGINAVVLVSLFGFSGVINVVFVFVPCHILLILCYMVASIDAVNNSLSVRRYGKGNSHELIKKLFIYLIPLVVICLCEAILMNVCCKAFIFVI